MQDMYNKARTSINSVHQFINEVEWFKYKGSVMWESERIMGDVANRIRYSRMNWWKAVTGVSSDKKSTVKGEKETLWNCCMSLSING